MKIIKFILFLLLILAGVIFFVTQIEKKDNELALKVDDRVTNIIVSSGINDVDVIHQYRKEHVKRHLLTDLVQSTPEILVKICRKLNLGYTSIWIETTREINIPVKCNVKELEKKLKNVSREFKVDINKYHCKLPEPCLKYIISRNKKDFQNLTFYLKGQVAHRVAIVIDDVGYLENKIDEFLSLNIPITFASV